MTYSALIEEVEENSTLTVASWITFPLACHLAESAQLLVVFARLLSL